MAVFKCKMCGGSLEIAEGCSVAECEYCGTTQTVPSADNEKKMTLFTRANRLRFTCEFDKAAGIYESIIAEFPEEAEAYWGLVLCKYGIEYVDDPATAAKVPTCHRSAFESVLDDSNFELVMEYADSAACAVYRSEAKKIEELRKGIIEVSSKEEPYDIFICYKETDEKGDRTVDSLIAQDTYDALTEKGYKVFFSRITLEDKLGQEYEPYIFAALNSAKVMLAFGTCYEHFNAVWVKNEWSRFLQLMAKGEKKTLIPCYKNLDAYDIPKEFAKLQAQDMGKVGALQDLLRGIEKIIPLANEQKVEAVRQTVVTNTATVDSLAKRAFIFLGDKNWVSANEYCEKILDIDPENAAAYLGKLMAGLHVSQKTDFAELSLPFDDESNYQKVMRYGDDALVSEMKSYIEHINNRNEEARLSEAYEAALNLLANANSEVEYKEAISAFEEIITYKDSEAKLRLCREGLTALLEEEEQARIERAQKEKQNQIERARKAEKTKKTVLVIFIIIIFVSLAVFIIQSVILPMMKYNSADKKVEEQDYDAAMALYEELGDYKDSHNKFISTRYLLACAQFENKEYEASFDNFKLIDNYEDSSEKIKESGYMYAQMLIDAEEYEEAIDVLNYIINYKDCADIRDECYLAYAKQFYKEKNYGKALTWYRKIEGYDSKAEFYIKSCYYYGLEKLESGEYQIAIVQFERAGDYKDANDYLKEAKYKYVCENKNSSDKLTYKYLKALKKENYKQSTAIFKELYGWKVEIISNDDEDSDKNMSSISKYSTWYFHVTLSGGEPGAETKLKYTMVNPEGSTASDSWESTWSDGDSGWASWGYSNPAYGREGKCTIKVYDGSGDLIGEHSVKITG